MLIYLYYHQTFINFNKHEKPSISGFSLFGEPNVPWVEDLFSSIFKTYEKLKELGFTYYNKKISVIEVGDEVEND